MCHTIFQQREMDMLYRDFIIEPNGLTGGFQAVHKDYDGAPDANDNRAFHGKDAADVCAQVDEWHEERQRPIADVLDELCAKHDLTRLDVGRYPGERFHVTAWWDGYSRSVACEAASGDTAEAAIAACLRKVKLARTPEPEAITPLTIAA